MHRFVLVQVVGLTLAATAAAYAQTVQSPAQKPPAAEKAKPAAQQPATPEPEGTSSLFQETWRQFQFGGRASNIDGDPARWQRYQDYGNGVLFTAARYAREHPDGDWLFKATADNVGWRDQRYFGQYERPGSFEVSGLWDQIPQFYSTDTKTPFTTVGGDLVLDDATQRAIQNGQANLNAYVPLAVQFDLRERRDIGNVNFLATPTPNIDLTASFTTQKHVGELPWGASFGFSNDVEVALPYDSRTNDLSMGAEWTNNKNMIRVGYSGSWFDNQDTPLVWDSPLDLDDRLDNPGRGRMSLWPTNSAHTLSAAGYSKFARRTQFTGSLSLGFWNNDEPLQPFTINAGLPVLPLPRETTEGQANVFSTTLGLVSHPATDWRFSARMRLYDYNNETPAASIPQFVSYDDEDNVSVIPGPHLYAHSRTTIDTDATYTGLSPVAFGVGYTRNNSSHDARIFESTGENVLRLTADATGWSSWISFRAQYEIADKSGSDLDESVLTEIHEQPAMRHYDIANRGRNRFTGQVDIIPNDAWSFSLSGGVGDDDYDDSYFGLQQADVRLFSLATDYRHPNGFGGGASYNYERYTGVHTSRSADDATKDDPLRDWTTDSKETVHYFSLYVMPPRIGQKTEARLSYDFSHAEGSYFYGVQPGGPLPAPSQLPNVFNKLQQLNIDVRHRVTNRVAATFQYLYEPFRVFDFAFDPTVVNGIVQPSSLVLGYVYRPYTAHSFNFGIRYFW